MFRLLLLFSMPYFSASLTEVILTRNQFNDFVTAIANISAEINIEDGVFSVDLSKIESTIVEQNGLLDIIVEQNNATKKVLDRILTTDLDLQSKFQKALDSLENLDNSVKNNTEVIVDALLSLRYQIQAFQQSENEHRTEWYNKFDNVMSPVNAVLADVNNAINILKETTKAVQTIFEAFQVSQDEAIDAIEAGVQTIATEFEVGMRLVVAEALAGASVSFAATECVAFEGDFCEYDPLGIGPIACEGTETELCQMEGLIVEPILKSSNIKELKSGKTSITSEDSRNEL